MGCGRAWPIWRTARNLAPIPTRELLSRIGQKQNLLSNPHIREFRICFTGCSKLPTRVSLRPCPARLAATAGTTGLVTGPSLGSIVSDLTSKACLFLPFPALRVLSPSPVLQRLLPRHSVWLRLSCARYFWGYFARLWRRLGWCALRWPVPCVVSTLYDLSHSQSREKLICLIKEGKKYLPTSAGFAHGADGCCQMAQKSPSGEGLGERMENLENVLNEVDNAGKNRIFNYEVSVNIGVAEVKIHGQSKAQVRELNKSRKSMSHLCGTACNS